jgi:hypothetical protein
MSETGMSITNVKVFGFEPALTDMRNPKESWDKSDSRFYDDSPISRMDPGARPWPPDMRVPELPFLGPDDLRLALGLIKGGGAHRKFLREIGIWWTITIPRAIWQELDTYKIATVRNSCSTMHKLGSRELVPSDFADEDIEPSVLFKLNDMGVCYRGKHAYVDERTSKVYEGVPLLRHMKLQLPESYLQRAGYVFNYESALKMYYDRHDHRMLEWSGADGICAHIRCLPYMNEFIEAARTQRG